MPLTARSIVLALSGVLLLLATPGVATAQPVTRPAREAEVDFEWPPAGGRLVDGIVAIVDKEPVTLFELERTVAPFVARLLAQGSNVDAEHLKKVRAEILDNLVNDKLILDEAHKMRLEVKAEQVDEQLGRLKERSNWGDDELAEALKRHGFPSINAYRHHVEQEILRNQVISIKVASKVQIPDKDVEEAIARELDGAGGVEERRAAHILLRLDEFASAEQRNERLARLTEIRQQAIDGEETFEELARRYSEDTNAASGGDLGWFAKGNFDPTFETRTFGLPKGGISEPFESPFGLHIVKVVDVRRKALEGTEDHEALRQQVRMRLREKEAARVYQQWIGGLKSQAFIEIRRQLLGLDT